MKVFRQFFNLYFSTDKHFVITLKNIIGFVPCNISLYKLAFILSSYENDVSKNNERLEFLGDAVLDSVVSEYLFRKYPYRNEGFLTEMRSKIVSRNQLNHIAVKLNLENLIKANETLSFNETKKSMLGDTLEALVGAIYMDKGYYTVKQFIINRLINIHINIDELETTEVNYKSRLFEWGHKMSKHIEFSVVKESFINNKKRYTVVLFIDEQEVARTEDFSKKNAEKTVAEKAYLLYINNFLKT